MPMHSRGWVASASPEKRSLVPSYKLERLSEVMPHAPVKRKRRANRKPSRVTTSSPALFTSSTYQVTLTPLQLLAVILKVVLEERITDPEIEKICSVYYDTVMKWYPLTDADV